MWWKDAAYFHSLSCKRTNHGPACFFPNPLSLFILTTLTLTKMITAICLRWRGGWAFHPLDMGEPVTSALVGVKATSEALRKRCWLALSFLLGCTRPIQSAVVASIWPDFSLYNFKDTKIINMFLQIFLVHIIELKLEKSKRHWKWPFFFNWFSK